MIYLVEDDGNIREFVLYALTGQGFDAQGFEKPSQFFAALEKQIPELVLLDLMLPEEDGLSVLKRFRAAPATRHVPVIILSAKDTEFDKVLGLDSGADDYLPKPFGMLELFSRIRAVLRRSQQALPPREYRAGALLVRPAQREALVNGEKIALTPKEFEILCLLLSNPGLVLSRGADPGSGVGHGIPGRNPPRWTSTSAPCARSWGPAAKLIETVRGVGYRLATPR